MLDANIRAIILTWLDELAVQQYSSHSIQAYHRDLMAFLLYCQQNKLDIFQLQMNDLRQYISYCVEQKHWSNQTIQRTLSAIRQFMQYLQQQGIFSDRQFKDFKIKHQPNALPGMLSIQTLNQLLDQAEPDNEKEKWLWQRDKAMLELLYSSGLRLHELVNLTIQHIDLKQQLLHIKGKGNKERIVPFGQKAKLALQQWLQLRQQLMLKHEFIFISQNGQQISHRQVQNRIKLQAQRAGLSSDIHPHLLRHCFASHLLSASGDIRAVQEMLGHSNLNTTQVYTHLDFNQLSKVYNKSHPRAKKHSKYT